MPIPEAVKSDKENRAIGLGVMGFSDTIEQLGMSYDAEHAWNFADRIFEFISYMAIDESANLAQERGSYANFAGSEWSKGHVPFDTLAKVEAERGRPLTVDKESKHKGLNWDVLRAKVKQGMRNATLMAVAPNANIGLVAATTPGIDARFAQIFSRNKISGKYIDINHNLVKDLKNMGIWEKVKDEIVERQGDIGDIAGIPQHIKDIYKTSFTTSPYAYIEVAARAQKWVDQALSRNMYLETRDIDDTMKIYQTAWEKGVKSTYYLHMKPRHTAEQSTVSVNKSQQTGKTGFGVLGLNKASGAFAMPLQKSLDSVLETPVASAPVTPTYVAPVVSAVAAPAVVKESEALVTAEKILQNAPVSVTTPIVEVPVIKSGGFASVAPAPVVTTGYPTGYQSMAAIKIPEPAPAVMQMPLEEEKVLVAKPAPVMQSSNAAKVCPIDPAERAQCDSCQ